MAVIKYTLDNSTTPAYITDGGYFRNPSDNTFIGIGSGGGTELTKAEVITRQKTLSNKYMEFNDEQEIISTLRNMTDAEIESKINNWYTAKGIS
jgi:hypothetical protein